LISQDKHNIEDSSLLGPYIVSTGKELPLIKSRLAHRKDKPRIYKNLIRPVISYG
jgi:hypothetical protein